MLKRALALVTLLAALLGPQVSAWAGETSAGYLVRAATLLDGARREADALQPRTGDKDFVAIVKTLAEARAKLGRKLDVPASLAKAHPHLLLVLEHCERAADAAEKGNAKKFMEHLTAARSEEKIYRAVLAELKSPLPSGKN